ncbi:hypothetical protein [Butyricimonas sp. Marseille-P3923]|uniref:hypothetical protein n=1 Tax=Butyricimonas TaxID=574697 RepID=UPI000C0895CC|nr:hypothetical protein [Butyricimonas sp. Marseille-P3923]
MYRILGFIILGLLGVACQKEGNLVSGEGIENYFEVPGTAMDEESVLRREFQKETGSYLLFNDTLRKEFLGRDEDGFPRYSFETVELGYGILSSSMDKFTFHYLENMEIKRAGVSFVKERLLALMDKSLAPYSFLLVNTILQYPFYLEEGMEASEGFYGEGYPINFYSGTRCMAISMGDILGMDDEEQVGFLKEIMIAMVSNMLTARPSVLLDFYAPGKDYYDKSGYMYELFPDLYINDLRELGFITGSLEYDEDYWDYRVQFPSEKEDVLSFMEVMFGDEDVFLEENAAYPIVIEKYNLLKKVVTDLGIHLEMF